MPRTSEAKNRPLSMRLPNTDIAIIDRAAGLCGRSRTDFIRDAAVRAAEQTILETTLVRMSPEGFAAFLDAISGPGRPVPEIVALTKREAPWEGDPNVSE